MRVLIFIVAFGMTLAIPAATAEKNIFCYFGSWSVYRPGKGKFEISTDIDASLCTHLVYTFVGLEGTKIKILDRWGDLPDGGGKDGFNRFNKIREEHPSVKTLIAIGGWNEGSRKYSQMAKSEERREEFAANAADFVQRYRFDGLDLDWEYPAQRGGAKQDVENYIELLKVLRIYFDERQLILSAAVAAPESSASKSYIIPEITEYLDFINVMTYDYHVGDEKKTDLHAPLHPGSNEDEIYNGWNVVESVQYWLDQGVPKEKLLVGIPFYGRSYTLCDLEDNKIGAPACGRGEGGMYSREPGMMGYNEICEQFKIDSSWKEYYDEERHSVYAHLESDWISYDNEKSIKKKAEFIKAMDLGGAMVWSIETDDFKGICGPKYPLLNTLNDVLRNAR